MQQDITDALIATQSFILTIYIFTLAFIDFVLNLVLPVKLQIPKQQDTQTCLSGPPERHRLQRLRNNLFNHHLRPR
jgi:hypothetical protein